MLLIELSHVIEHGMITYPGLPGPEIGDHLTFDGSEGLYEPGTEFAIGTISMVTNTGTYLDTPAHRYRDGHDLSGLPLERCALLPALVVAASGAIGADSFAGVDLAGKAVLLHTGWDEHWGTEQYYDPVHPHVSEEGARALVAGGAVLVGIDSVNIDDTVGGGRPAHTILLGAQIPVVEHLTRLGEVPAEGARFTAVPPAIRGLGTFTVRAFASTGHT